MLQLVLGLYIFKQNIEGKINQELHNGNLLGLVAEGFTLAEVLITLTIVGIIASLTIPSLVNNVNNTTNVVQLKKAYADLQQAFMLLQTDNGGSIIPVFQNDTLTNNGNGNAMNAFLAKLNYVKNCGNNMGCWYDVPRYNLNRTVDTSQVDTYFSGKREKAILANGSMMYFAISSISCSSATAAGPLANVCGWIDVDLNGANGPNTCGKDIFEFWMTQTGIYPIGSFNDGRNCNISPGDWANSSGCAAKVLTEGAMNY